MLASGAQCIPGISIEEQGVDMEDGDLTSVEVTCTKILAHVVNEQFCKQWIIK